ncbi:hypothetical protein EC973_002888 [Apophysomyces ossiformis]|uniref:Uncharacterized protein n=1 Tax=Apophysomyces ossiformis TaxID=679940 RepID=A0A8H7BRY4_9FUNG|nr:hypothetical protein EC973_002888 [Apophysomyces ossiformis]
MNMKIYATLIAMASMAIFVNAQVPALNSLNSKMTSITSSNSGTHETALMSSAHSAFSRISAGVSSHISGFASSSSSALGVLSSLRSQASSLGGTNLDNAGAALMTDFSSTMIFQAAALVVLFVASFVVMLA